MFNFELKGGNRSAGEFGASIHAPDVANTVAVINLSAVSGKRHLIGDVQWSYDVLDLAAAGRLFVESPVGTVVKDIDIIKGGPGEITLNYIAANNTAVRVSLAAVSGAKGKLNINTMSGIF